MFPTPIFFTILSGVMVSCPCSDFLFFWVVCFAKVLVQFGRPLAANGRKAPASRSMGNSFSFVVSVRFSPTDLDHRKNFRTRAPRTDPRKKNRQHVTSGLKANKHVDHVKQKCRPGARRYCRRERAQGKKSK